MDKFKNYYTDILDSAGFKEWEDGFNFENIPRNIFDKAYHITWSIAGVETSGQILENQVDTEVRVFFKGFRDPSSAIDQAMAEAVALRQSILSPVNIASFTEEVILGITSVSIIPEPVPSNDNSFIVVMSFNTRVNEIIC